MSTTLLRLGLWILVLVMALYVIDASYADQPIADMIQTSLLQQATVLAVLLLIAGVVVRILGKGAQVVTKNRCRVCRTPIASGAIYCREHLRSILSEEDAKVHSTRIR